MQVHYTFYFKKPVAIGLLITCQLARVYGTYIVNNTISPIPINSKLTTFTVQVQLQTIFMIIR